MLLATAIAAAPAAADEVVYISIDDNGELTFSDEEAPGAAVVPLPPASSPPSDSQAQVDAMLEVAASLERARLQREEARQQSRRDAERAARQARELELIEAQTQAQAYARDYPWYQPYPRYPQYPPYLPPAPPVPPGDVNVEPDGGEQPPRPVSRRRLQRPQ